MLAAKQQTIVKHQFLYKKTALFYNKVAQIKAFLSIFLTHIQRTISPRHFTSPKTAMEFLFFKTHPTGTKIIDTAQNADFTWADLTREAIELAPNTWQTDIERITRCAIDEHHIADILNPQHPSFFEQTNDYDILIFRKLRAPKPSSRPNPAATFKLQTAPATFILTDHALITIRDASSPTFSVMRQRMSAQANQPKSRLPNSPLDLCLRMLNTMIDKYLELRTPMTRQIEHWQAELLQGSHRFNQWQQLLNENLGLQKLESLCEEQGDALQELKDSYLDQQNTSHKNATRRDLILIRINDLLEHVERVQNHASRLELALKSAVDLHFSATANQTNETMRFLAILTAIFAPLTLLTGIYGMNFDVIPGLHNPHGFWWMLGGRTATTAGLLYYFRRRSLVGRGQRSVTQLLSEKGL